MWEFQKLMLEDIRIAKKQALKMPTPFALRTLIRTATAYIEGTVYQLRLVCLAALKDAPNYFSPEEAVVLQEKYVTIDNKGNIKEKDDFQKILPSILFTFSLFAKLHNIGFKPEISDHRWDSLKKLFEIRNALMHPKIQSDFEISQQKNQWCFEGLAWFQENLKTLYRACEKADMESKSKG